MWSVRALANLTTVTPDKYCSLVMEEGGLTLMEEILNENTDQFKTSVNQVKEWAAIVRSNVINWQESGDLHTIDGLDNLDFDG